MLKHDYACLSTWWVILRRGRDRRVSSIFLHLFFCTMDGMIKRSRMFLYHVISASCSVMHAISSSTEISFLLDDESYEHETHDCLCKTTHFSL